MTADPRGWHLHDFGSGRTVVHNESGLYVAEFLNHSDAAWYLACKARVELEDALLQRRLNEGDEAQAARELAEHLRDKREWESSR